MERIRNAVPADVDALTAIEAACFPAAEAATREEFAARQSEAFVEEAFGGSLPRFLAAFTRRKPLSQEELAALEALIADSRRG